MQEEKQLTGPESLALITSMIKKAKSDYYETGVSALLWGGVITICSLVTFANYFLRWPYLSDYIWTLTLAAVIPQIIIASRERKIRKRKGHEDDIMRGIWTSFGISIFILSWILGWFNLPHLPTIFLTVYAIPTFATGYGRNFRPMIIGGIACWVFSILAIFTPFPYVMLYMAAAAQMAWFIPGIILRRRMKAAKENV